MRRLRLLPTALLPTALAVAFTAAFTLACPSSFVDPLASIVVEDAHLEGVELWQAGLVLGKAEGKAVLVIHDTVGQEHVFDATLGGSHAGLVADASTNVTDGAEYPLRPPPNTNARQLVTSYEGPHVALDVGVGFHFRELTSATGVKLNVTTLSLGVGAVPFSWETLAVVLVDDPIEIVDDPCASDGICDASCGEDLDSDLDCCASDDGFCDAGCGEADVDCCASDGSCDESCGEADLDCPQPCGADGLCDATCLGGADPDCAQGP